MSDLPKIVYFGSDAICLPGLRYLVEQASHLCTLAAVVTQPDRRQGRGKKLQQNPVAAYASEQGIQLLQPDKPDAALAEWLRTESVALAFVMAYGHFLPKSVREAPTHGMLNFHGSLLPAYRGASPVETAIALGEQETGVCLMQIVKEMDAGDVADRESVRIESTDTSPIVRAKVGEAVVPLLQRDLAAALSGQLDFVPQDVSQATFCRKISKEDGALDFNQSAAALDARLRAFTPWPGGYFDHRETRVKVGRCTVSASSSRAQPGTVVAVGDCVEVATAEGVVSLHELQRPGGRMLPAPDFLRGYPIEEGEVLASVASAPLLV
ncbi:MAG: methionyl-tRNA formyltransferase [Puniceicoccaceae bacterium]|nr:methionyl-tRNA formyltransferase [Puniceicoccaceae bacterium]|tara:strand:+ start:1151 stop:2122 length:972 start_codon:yes stop_codon:yes gene_type:complete